MMIVPWQLMTHIALEGSEVARWELAVDGPLLANGSRRARLLSEHELANTLR